jgi:hypothetical protein
MMRAFVFAVLALVGLTTSADAGSRVGVVVVGDDSFKSHVAAELERWLQRNGHEVVPAPLTPAEIESMSTCFASEDEACARGVFEKGSETGELVFTRLETEEDSEAERTLVVTAYWFAKGREGVAERRHCERCVPATLAHTTDDLMRALSRAGQRGTGMLKVSSTPTGARVLVDGTAIGVTPLEYQLTTGEHLVTLELDRHEIATRHVTIRTGETAPLDVPLATLADRPRPWRTLALSLLAGGVVGVAAGITLYATSETPDGSKPEYRDTKAGGLTLGAAGVVATGIGAYLWFRSGSESTTPTIALTREGVAVGWAKTF